MRHQALGDRQFRARVKRRFCFPVGRIDAADLNHLHHAGRTFGELDDSRRIQYPLTRTVALTVMLFDIFKPCVFADKKPVNAVMLRRFAAGIMNSAARDNQHVGTLADIKIVIDLVVSSRIGQHNRNMHRLALCKRHYPDINTGFVGF